MEQTRRNGNVRLWTSHMMMMTVKHIRDGARSVTVKECCAFPVGHNGVAAWCVSRDDLLSGYDYLS